MPTSSTCASGSTKPASSAKRCPSWCANISIPGDATKADEIREQLRALGDPTRMYTGQLPLFPEIYRLEVRFSGPSAPPQIVWDCEAPPPEKLPDS